MTPPSRPLTWPGEQVKTLDESICAERRPAKPNVGQGCTENGNEHVKPICAMGLRALSEGPPAGKLSGESAE